MNIIAIVVTSQGAGLVLLALMLPLLPDASHRSGSLPDSPVARLALCAGDVPFSSTLTEDAHYEQACDP
jgi:hypothetical protein